MLKEIVVPTTESGRFNNGDPTKGIPGTVVTAEFLNGLIDSIVSMSGEIKGVLRAAAIENIDGEVLLSALDALYLKKDEKGTDVGSASTNAAGIVKLNDTVTSLSTTEAATARVVKLAYDLAKEAKDKSVSGATTAEAGVVKLNDTVTSVSTTEAATARAVKQAYDWANVANSKMVLPVFGNAGNGYFINQPDGRGIRMITQWGVSNAGRDVLMPFPIAFPNQCIYVIAIFMSVSSTNVYTLQTLFTPNKITTSGFSMRSDPNVIGTSYRWFAIGY